MSQSLLDLLSEVDDLAAATSEDSSQLALQRQQQHLPTAQPQPQHNSGLSLLDLLPSIDPPVSLHTNTTPGPASAHPDVPPAASRKSSAALFPREPFAGLHDSNGGMSPNAQHDHERDRDRPLLPLLDTSHGQVQAHLLSPTSERALIDAMLDSPVKQPHTATPAPTAIQNDPTGLSLTGLNVSASASLATSISHQSWHSITPMPPSTLASIPDPLSHALAVEQQKSLIGNYQIVEPLRHQREARRAAAVQNIVRLAALPGVRSELERARATVGEATSCALHGRWIAVGTTRGVVLVFDHMEQLCVTLGKAEEGRARGSVDCLDLNASGDVLLAGYLRGGCVLWDVQTKQAIKEVKDVSLRPITAAHFIRRDRLHFVAVDDVGVVTLLLVTKKLMWTVSKSVLVPGKAGRVLGIAVLQPNPQFPHASDAWPLIAVCLESMSMVIALDPKQPERAYMAARFPREDARVGALPSVCWRSLQARDEAANRHLPTSEREQLLVRHPVLVLARGSTISYIQCQPMDKQEVAEQRPEVPLKFNHVGINAVEGQVIAVEWMGGAVLAAITEVESNAEQDVAAPAHELHLRVLDPFELDSSLEDLTLQQFALLPHQFFPNPETGEMELGADAAVKSSDNLLLLLGASNLLISRVLTWSDRVDALVSSGQWIDALSLSLDFYQGRAKAAIGLPRDPVALQQALKDRVLELLVEYVTVTILSRNAPTDKRTLRVVGACAMEYCLAIDRLDILFTDIYAKFFAVDATDVLCELVEPYILNDKMRVLGPDVMPKFLEHYAADALRLPPLEQCILHLDIEQLAPSELVLLIDIARQARLVTALIVLHSKGKHDFGAPIADVCSICVQGRGFGTQVGPDALDGPRMGDSGSIRGDTVAMSASDPDSDPLSTFGGSLNAPFVIGATLPSLSWSDQLAISHALFLFLDYAFTGCGFPRGEDLPDAWFSGAKAQILAVLFTRQATLVTSVTKQSAPLPLPDYPWLSFGLNVSAPLTFSIIAQAFDSQDWTRYLESDSQTAPRELEQPSSSNNRLPANSFPMEAILIPEGESLPPEFLTGVAAATQFSPSPSTAPLTASNVPSRQSMLDALTFLIIDGAQSVPSSLSVQGGRETAHPCVYQSKPEDATMLFTFAAKYIGRGTVTASASLCDRIFENLTADSEHPPDSIDAQKDRAQRETLLITLLNRIGASNEFDYERLLARCQAARFYHVCVFLYKKRKDFARILQYYIASLEDASTSGAVRQADDSALFEFIAQSITEATEPAVQERLRRALFDRMPDLVKADALLTAKLIVQHFPGDLEPVIDALDTTKSLQFQFLHTVMTAAPQDNNPSNTTNARVDTNGASAISHPFASPASPRAFSAGPLLETSSLSLSDLLDRSGVSISPKLHEAYLNLLGEFSPTSVLPYLQRHSSFSLVSVLRMCQARSIDDAAAYLLEKTGDVSGALALILKSVSTKVRELGQFLAAHAAEFDTVDALETSGGYFRCHRAVLDSISQAAALCQRSGEGDKLWFQLLDCFVHMQRKRKGSSGEDNELLHRAIIGYVRAVLHAMMGFVTMPSILRKITADHQADPLREFRDLIVSMLDTYSYEQNILTIATQLINADQFSQIALLAAKQKYAFTPRSDYCELCHRPINATDGHAHARSDEAIDIFDCLHAVHQVCNRQQHALHTCPTCQQLKQSQGQAPVQSPASQLEAKAHVSADVNARSPSDSVLSTDSADGQRRLSEAAVSEIVSHLSLVQKRAETAAASLEQFQRMVAELADSDADVQLQQQHDEPMQPDDEPAEEMTRGRAATRRAARGAKFTTAAAAAVPAVPAPLKPSNAVSLALRPRSLPSTLPAKKSAVKRGESARTVGALPEISKHENAIQLTLTSGNGSGGTTGRPIAAH